MEDQEVRTLAKAITGFLSEIHSAMLVGIVVQILLVLILVVYVSYMLIVN